MAMQKDRFVKPISKSEIKRRADVKDRQAQFKQLDKEAFERKKK